jgi:hypothetical protein
MRPPRRCGGFRCAARHASPIPTSCNLAAASSLRSLGGWGVAQACARRVMSPCNQLGEWESLFCPSRVSQARLSRCNQHPGAPGRNRTPPLTAMQEQKTGRGKTKKWLSVSGHFAGFGACARLSLAAKAPPAGPVLAPCRAGWAAGFAALRLAPTRRASEKNRAGSGLPTPRLRPRGPARRARASWRTSMRPETARATRGGSRIGKSPCLNLQQKPRKD